jgi:hypothetical protein
MRATSFQSSPKQMVMKIYVLFNVTKLFPHHSQKFNYNVLLLRIYCYVECFVAFVVYGKLFQSFVYFNGKFLVGDKLQRLKSALELNIQDFIEIIY